MKIRRLHIYGFGKLVDEIIDLDDTFHVIYGQNESGKSTIHAFIEAILFGFPTKKEKLLRYEPKTASAYGGSLTVELAHHGTVVIERTKKRKTRGEMTVFFENGETAGEHWLRQMLGPIDRATFQGIFCFGLDGLSKIGQLKGEALNQYLFEAGMTGTNQLHAVEKEIMEQIERLFKKRGKKPLINQLLTELQQRKMELRKWEKEFDRYDELLLEKEKVIEELKKGKSEKEQLQRKLFEWERKQTLKRLWEETKTLQTEKKFLEKSPLIPKEVELEGKNLFSLLEEWKKQIQTWEEWKKVAEMKMIGASVSVTFWKEKETVAFLKEQLPLYNKLNEDITRFKQKQQQVKEKLQSVKERLGLVSEETLIKANTTVFAEEDLKEKLRTYQQSKEKYDQLYYELERQEALLKSVQKERERLKEKERNADSDKTFPYTLSIGVVVFFILAISELFRGNVFFGTVSLLLAGLLSLFIAKQRVRLFQGKSPTMTPRQEKEWEYEREHRIYDEMLSQLTTVERQIKRNEQSLQAWKEKYHFRFVSSLERLEIVFQFVKEWKDDWQELKRINEEIARMKKQQEKIESRANDMKRENSQQKGFEAFVTEFLQRWEVACREQEQYDKRAKEYVEKYEEKRAVQETYAQLHEQLQTLLEVHRVSSVEQLSEGATNDRRYKEIEKQLEWLKEKMKEQVPDEMVRKRWLKEFEENSVETFEEDKINQLLAEADEKQMAFQEKLAFIKQQIQSLEEDGTYEDKLQQFVEKRETLRKYTEEWAVLQTALLLIEKVKKVYERERQPAVIQQASKYFSYITGVEQYRLFAPVGENTFIIEDGRGIRFTPEELSRGTAEQLYLSLRLALANTFSQREKLPLVMDDPFVNFDSDRKQKLFSLLQREIRDRQIIYFTCHDISNLSLATTQVTYLSSKSIQERNDDDES